MKINEFIVVEGRDDTERVKRAVECDTIETNGSAINEQTLEVIRNAQQSRGVIVLTDQISQEIKLEVQLLKMSKVLNMRILIEKAKIKKENWC